MDKRLNSEGFIKLYIKKTQNGKDQQNTDLVTSDTLLLMLKVIFRNDKVTSFKVDFVQKSDIKPLDRGLIVEEDTTTQRPKNDFIDFDQYLQYALDRIEYYGKGYGVILDNNNSDEVADSWQNNLLKTILQEESKVTMEVSNIKRKGSIDYSTKPLKNYIYDLREIGYENVNSKVTPLAQIEGKYLEILQEAGRYSDQNLANLNEFTQFRQANDGTWRRKVWYAQFFEGEHNRSKHQRQNVWVMKELELILKENPSQNHLPIELEKSYKIFWGNTKIVAILTLEEFQRWQ